MAARERQLKIGLVALAWAVFWPVLTHGFLNFDDDLYVVGNPVFAGGWLKAFTVLHHGNWYPLTLLSHALDVRLFGLAAVWHHLENLVLHTANTLLVFALLRRMTADLWRSAAVAAVFAVHPLQLESVAWIAERKNLLCALFSLLTLMSWARGKLLQALGWYAAALMSKAAAVPLPFVMLALEHWPLRRRPRLLEKLPFGVLAFGCSLLTLQAAQERNKVELLVRLANAGISCWGYLRRLAWPQGLCIFYPHPGYSISLALGAAAAAALAVVTILALRRSERPWLAAGWLSFLLLLGPVIGLVQVGEQALADRYMYFAMIPLLCAVFWTVPDRFLQRPSGVGAAGAALGALMVVSGLQLRYWHDSLTLWRRAMDVTEGNYMAMTNLSYELLIMGRDREALPLARAALREKPDGALARANYGFALAKGGELRKGEIHLEKALEIYPASTVIARNLEQVRRARAAGARN